MHKQGIFNIKTRFLFEKNTIFNQNQVIKSIKLMKTMVLAILIRGLKLKYI